MVDGVERIFEKIAQARYCTVAVPILQRMKFDSITRRLPRSGLKGAIA